MWTVHRIPWLVQIELVQILFSQVALKSQVNGLDECLVPWAGKDSSCPALSGDHDTSVTKQRDATNCYCCCTKYLCNSVLHCSAVQLRLCRTKTTLSWKLLWISGYLTLCLRSHCAALLEQQQWT